MVKFGTSGMSSMVPDHLFFRFRQECILNAESRHTKPDLFIPEEDDFTVDYFDINCRLEAERCPGGRAPKLVRTLNAALPEGEGAIHVVETARGGVQECAQKWEFLKKLRLQIDFLIRKLPKILENQKGNGINLMR